MHDSVSLMAVCVCLRAHHEVTEQGELGHAVGLGEDAEVMVLGGRPRMCQLLRFLE